MSDRSEAENAAQSAQSSFPQSAPNSIGTCPTDKPAPGGGASPATPWTIDDLKKNLDKCDGGTDIYNKAKTANGGKAPTIKKGASAIGSGGSVNTSTGEITLDTGQSKCDAKQTLVMELSNLSNKPAFDKIDHVDAPAGNLSREEFIRGQEKIEYDGLQNVIKAFDACKDKWGCTTCTMEWARPYKKFDDYYKVLSNDHKEHYGKEWDSKYKTVYEAKHPATPPAKPPAKTPPATPPPPAAKKEGCFIATSAYGSSLAPEVQFLRELRDDVLRKTQWGHKFFEDYWRYYYQISPEIAAQMDTDPELKNIIRWSVVTPLVNYLKLLVKRPRTWDLDEPELKEFLEEMKADMESWLAHVELPENFEGLDNRCIIDELNIALNLVLKERTKADEFLDGLIVNGALPLSYDPEEELGLLTRLAESGRSVFEINRIMYGKQGSSPAVDRIKELALDWKQQRP